MINHQLCRQPPLAAFGGRTSSKRRVRIRQRHGIVASAHSDRFARQAAHAAGVLSAGLVGAWPCVAAETSSSTASLDPASFVWAVGGAALGAAAVSLLRQSETSATDVSMNASGGSTTSAAAAADAVAKEAAAWAQLEQALKDEITRLEKQLEQSRTQEVLSAPPAQAPVVSNVDTAAVERLEQKIASLENSLSIKETAFAEAQREASDLQEKLQRAVADAAAAEARAREAQSAAAGVGELETALQQAREESASKDAELVSGRMERESLKFKVIDAQKKVEEAENASQAAIAALEQAKADAAAARQEISAKQEALDRAVMQRTNAEHQLAARDKQIEASYGDQNELLSRLETAATEREQLEAALGAAVEDASAAKSLVTAEREKLATVDAARAAAVQEARNMLAERREAASAAEEAQAEAAAKIAEERLGRIAAEKALESYEHQIKQLVEQMKAAQQEAVTLQAALTAEHKRMLDVEEDAQLAAKDAKDSLHREMEALAEAQRQVEASEALRHELAATKKALAAAEAVASAAAATAVIEPSEVVVEAPKKKRGRPKKVVEATNAIIDVSVGSASGDGSLSEEEMVQRVTAADAAVAEAQAAAEEAQQRAFEIRAEAALLVETVEDRAVEAVEAAQAEVARLKAELERVAGGQPEE